MTTVVDISALGVHRSPASESYSNHVHLQKIINIKAVDHSISVSGFSCTLVGSLSVTHVVLSGYRFVPLLVHSVFFTPLTNSSSFILDLDFP